MRRSTIRVLFFLLVACRADAGTSEKIVQSVFRLESGTFSEAYVQHAFDQWLKTTGARLTETIEIYSTNRRGQTELWVEGLDLPDGGSYDLSFDLDEDGRIADVRRLLIRQREALSDVDEEVARFVERFVWVYDTDSATLLRDFLYPSYVTLQYGGHPTVEESVGQLRKDFPAPLSVVSVSWERSDITARVSLSPAPESQTPVMLKVDIPRYVAASGSDTYEKADALRDSLVLWSKERPYRDLGSYEELRTIEISSETDVVITLQEEVFRGYKVILLDSTRYVIEASLPPFHGNIPATLRYRLSVVGIDTPTMRVQPRIEMDVQVSDSLVRWYGGEALPKPETPMADSTLEAALLRENIHRYRSLSLPPAFQPLLRTGASFESHLTVYQKRGHRFSFSDLSSWNDVLGKLSKDTFAYYTPRSIEMGSEGIEITGYAVWKKRSEAWHHFAKVCEVHAEHNDGMPSVAQVWMDLYPFIRTDYLADLFATSKERGAGRRQFQIRMR